MPEAVVAFKPSELTSGLYSVAEAAKRLGVTERTAHTWIREDKFPVPVININGRTRIAVAVLERFLLGEVAS